MPLWFIEGARECAWLWAAILLLYGLPYVICRCIFKRRDW